VITITDPGGTLRAAQRLLASVPRQVRFAAVGGINDALFEAKQAETAAMQQVFDRPTPYILKSALVRRADRDQAAGEIYIDFFGRGKGVAPEKILQAEVFGGRRRAKRAELALQRVGLMPPGWAMVPGPGAQPHLDAYGNVKGSFIVQLLSYLQAFGEQGYRANMTARRRKALAKLGRSERGFKTILGVQYFVSRGKGTWGALPSAGRQGREQTLPAGIWARSGIHGAKVTNVFRFVPLPRYAQRFDFHRVARETVAAALPAAYERRMQAALETFK
jgi:hypothetical protein